MSLPELITRYGYVAVFVGSVLEGETILVLAGFAAYQGYLSLPWVVVLAFAGGTLGDQVYFFVGRKYGKALLRRVPRLAGPAERVKRLIQRYHAGLIVGVRFMYGLRLIGPMVIGMSHVPPWRFVLFNVIGAAIWAVAVTGVGFLFGETLKVFLAGVQHFEEVALLSIVATAGVLALVRWLRWGRRK